jgi:hypothetical protein
MRGDHRHTALAHAHDYTRVTIIMQVELYDLVDVLTYNEIVDAHGG